MGLKVGILNPQKHPSKVLEREAYFLKDIRPGIIKISQFPDTLKDLKGHFTNQKNGKENHGIELQGKTWNQMPKNYQLIPSLLL